MVKEITPVSVRDFPRMPQVAKAKIAPAYLNRADLPPASRLRVSRIVAGFTLLAAVLALAMRGLLAWLNSSLGMVGVVILLIWGGLPAILGGLFVLPRDIRWRAALWTVLPNLACAAAIVWMARDAGI